MTQGELFLAFVLWSWFAHLQLYPISVETWHSLSAVLKGIWGGLF